MTGLVDMSRAVRHVIEDYSSDKTLQTVKTLDLRDFVDIIGAFYADLEDELATRETVTA